MSRKTRVPNIVGVSPEAKMERPHSLLRNKRFPPSKTRDSHIDCFKAVPFITHVVISCMLRVVCRWHSRNSRDEGSVPNVALVGILMMGFFPNEMAIYRLDLSKLKSLGTSLFIDPWLISKGIDRMNVQRLI
jgi:hypothetical protein